MISKKPYLFFLILALILGSAATGYYFYQEMSDPTYSNREDTGLALFLGLSVLKIPVLLFYSLVYYLMFRFKKPTKPLFNSLHIAFFIINFLVNFYAAHLSLIENQRGSSMDVYITIGFIIGVLAFSIFAGNIIYSLVTATKRV